LIFPPDTITFSLDNTEEAIGQLYKEDGLLCFRGNMEKSAEVLFEYVCKIYNDKEFKKV
jgi:hypothetical protein